MKKAVIVNLCPTGMIPTKAMTSHVPIEPQEIIDNVLECCEIGITMVHLHAREDGEPTWKPEIYHQIIQGIKKHAPDLIICVSTSGRTFSEFAKRAAVLDVEGVDMGSLTLSSVNFNKVVSVNHPDMIAKLAVQMKIRDIKPELEVFDSGMINFAKYLIKKDLLDPPYYFNLILGNISCMQPSLLGLGYLLSELPQPSIVSVGGIGLHQQYAHGLALAEGLGVRVGLEDNIWYNDARTQLATNKMLVNRIHGVAEAMGSSIMKPKELRWKFQE